VEKLKDTFGLTRVVLAGDRGMLTQKQIEALKIRPGLGWISALRSGAIRELVEGGALQMSLFDQGLGEFSSPVYPANGLSPASSVFSAVSERGNGRISLPRQRRNLPALSGRRGGGRRRPSTRGRSERE
jgi:hypothetical protein